MSGPLASWASVHSRLEPRPRSVLVQIALECHHDGTPDYDLTKDELAQRTGLSRATITRSLATIRDSGEVHLLKTGDGRGHASSYQIVVWFCQPDGGCHSCMILAKVQKGAQREPLSHVRGGPGEGQKEAHSERKEAQREPHLGTDLGTPYLKGVPKVRGEWSHSPAASPDGAAGGATSPGRNSQEQKASARNKGEDQGDAPAADDENDLWGDPEMVAVVRRAHEVLTGRRPDSDWDDELDIIWKAATAAARDWLEAHGAKQTECSDPEMDGWQLTPAMADQVADKWLSDDGLGRVEGFTDVPFWLAHRKRWPARPHGAEPPR